MQPDTQHEIITRLTLVCKRQRSRAVLQGVGRGLLYGSAIALAIGLLSLALAMWPFPPAVLPDAAKWLFHWALLTGLAVTALVVGPLIGVWHAVRHEPEMHAAAALVDRHYRLQDRTITALGFLEKADRRPLEEMQIADCTERLSRLDPRAVVRLGLPRPLPAALVLSALAVAAIVAPAGVRPPKGPPVEPAPEATAADEPTVEEPSPLAAATAARSAAEIEWQVAPLGEVIESRSSLPADATLEEIASDTGRPATGSRAGDSAGAGDAEGKRPTEIVLEGELLPLEHRRTIRRYFESIRPQEHELPGQPPAAP